MKQTHLLKLPNGLSVTFIINGNGCEVKWSRNLYKKDLASLEEFYVPWRDKILIGWAIQNNTGLDFADLPMLELITRHRKRCEKQS